MTEWLNAKRKWNQHLKFIKFKFPIKYTYNINTDVFPKLF